MGPKLCIFEQFLGVAGVAVWKSLLRTRLITNGALGNSLAVQWLELCTFTAKGLSSTPGQGTKILQDVWCSYKKKSNQSGILQMNE